MRLVVIVRERRSNEAGLVLSRRHVAPPSDSSAKHVGHQLFEIWAANLQLLTSVLDNQRCLTPDSVTHHQTGSNPSFLSAEAVLDYIMKQELKKPQLEQ